ncbi:unnamed protein product, partial [Citrullus colocynthis]
MPGSNLLDAEMLYWTQSSPLDARMLSFGCRQHLKSPLLHCWTQGWVVGGRVAPCQKKNSFLDASLASWTQ